MPTDIYNNPNRFYVYLWCYGHDVIYVGKGSYNRGYKFSGRNKSTKLCNKLKSIINKGENLKDAITVILVHENLPEDEAFRLEKSYYAWLPKDKLCNLTEGGEGCSKPCSKEAKEKHKISMTGKKLTPEQIEKARQSHIGKKRSDKARQNMREAQKGKIISEDTRNKISFCTKGIPKSQNFIDKISKWWKPTSPIGEEFIILNLFKFCKDHGLNCSCMVLVAQGKYKHHKGWKCEYYIK